jgi:hypothetical protein
MGIRTVVAQWVAGLIAMAVLGATAGCDGASSLPFSQLEPSAQQAACHLIVLCGDSPDQATCLASQQVPPHYYDTLAQDVASGKVRYDGVKARACFDAVNAVSSCHRTGLSVLSVDPDCTSIFTGTVAVGGACFFGEECAPGGACKLTDASCSSSATCCPGTCIAVPPPVAAGGACPAFPGICASRICVVDSIANTETCQTPVGLGASCLGATPCETTLYCDPVSETCKEPVGTGGACNPALTSPPLVSEDCDGVNDRCSATTSVCTPLLAVGSPCDPATSGCVTYAICDATTNTCVERPAVGAVCDPTGAGPSCLGGSCDATTATCTLTPAAGACP